MRTIDHAAFALRFGKNVLGIKSPIKKISFWLGNLLPDYSYHTYHKSIGHGFRTARKKLVLAWQSRHFRGEGAAFYYRLGVAAHYLCDSFTYPHSKLFKGTLSQHIEYENELHRQLGKQNGNHTENVPVFDEPLKCMRYLESKHKSYLRHPEKSPLADFKWITEACTTALLTSLKIPLNEKISVKRILSV